MTQGYSRGRASSFDGDEPDEWLVDAARRAGHKLPGGERPRGTTAWRLLLNAGISDDEVLKLACAASGADPADFGSLSPSLGTLLPHGLALKHRVAPLGVRQGSLGVATSNPRNPELERELAFAAKQRVRLYAASPTDVIRAQGMVYGGVYGTKGDSAVAAAAPAPLPIPAPPAIPQPKPAPVARMSLQMTVPDEALSDDPLIEPEPEPVLFGGAVEPAFASDALTPQAPATPAAAPAPAPAPPPPRPRPPEPYDRLLNSAVAERASEAILEPSADGSLLVRLRVDGTVHDRFRIPEAHAGRMVQALKQRAGIEGGDVAHPRRGRLAFQSSAGPLAVRIIPEPAPEGRERLVLHLRAADAPPDLPSLGFDGETLRLFLELLARENGLVIVAGPTGAGRTTTMYAAAIALHAGGRVVSTVEELAEQPLPGIAQVELGDEHGKTAATVRTALDGVSEVVIIGEALDAHTLAQCDRAKGHEGLALAALESDDFPTTVARLVALRRDREQIAGSLAGVVSQRLVRRLCTECAAPQAVSELPELQQNLLRDRPTSGLRRPVGCAACRGTGYRGRMAIAEVVPVGAELRAAIARGAPPPELSALARQLGMPTLWDAGMLLVLDGVIALAELLDTVTPPAVDGGGAPQEDIDALLSQLLGSPLVPAPARRAPVPTPTAPSVAAAPSPASEFTIVDETPAAGPGLRVLLVDDDAAVRRALAQELVAEGFQVLQAADGASALAFVERLRPDVVLTEVALPVMDAIGLLKALAALPAGAAPPVVVHTDQADAALDSWLRESGARVVLRRGMPMAELARRLKVVAGVGPGGRER